jgi:hypothetical protein
MKATLVVALFGVLACIQAIAQDQPAGSACGPATAHFDTETGADHTVAQPEPGKGQVYVIEVFDKVVGEISRPTLRVGLDGAWMGADKGNSYVVFPVAPGEHHLCVNWQSHWKRLSDESAFFGFTAEAGKVYYFRARIIEEGGARGASNASLDLDAVNADEGRYLVSSSAFSASHQK